MNESIKAVLLIRLNIFSVLTITLSGTEAVAGRGSGLRFVRFERGNESGRWPTSGAADWRMVTYALFFPLCFWVEP
jgi:hypothetical protein